MNWEKFMETVGQIPLGTVVVWCIGICSVIFTIYKSITKIYGVFIKYKTMREENEEQKTSIKEHDKLLKNVFDALEEIKGSLEEQKEVNLRQIRYTIVHTCDDAISDGYISAGKLKSLEEMYEEYTDIFHGNGYVRIMVEKVRLLPVRGKLDE